MDMLLDDEIAREPGEVKPVAHLPLHVAPAALALAVPQGAGVVRGLDGDDIADGAVVDTVHDLAHRGMVAPAEAGNHGQAISLGFPTRGLNAADTGTIHGHRLLGEDVLARPHRRFQVSRPEMRRRT